MQELFKCLVGSRAHGLNDETSDYDYRGVFAVPTTRILGLGANPKTTHWIEGDVDDTSWEIGHFLHLATKCNPTILEAFCSPLKSTTKAGDMVRALFPHVWNSRGVFDAFRGYSMNQRKKFLDDKDGRAWKFAVAYIRTLWQGTHLLYHGVLPINVQEVEPVMHQMLRAIRNQEMTRGQVLDLATKLERDIATAYEENSDKETNLEAVNEALLYIRRIYWEEGDETTLMQTV